jgi:hypothetical protein
VLSCQRVNIVFTSNVSDLTINLWRDFGDYRLGCVLPNISRLTSVPMPLKFRRQLACIYEMAGADHYRELAGGLRQLARQCHFAGARKELLRLAANYERRGDHIDQHCLPQ